MASINYNDSRFTELEKDKQSAINKSNSTYDNLINESQGYYDDLINQSKDWANKQAEIQNQQTEFAIEKIEQQKEQANKDYVKEQKGAYQDYMKQSNAYGSNMQKSGEMGLGGSGWSETIQAGFYNTYQNRYAMARESYGEIVMNYNNNIKEAQLQNSSALAQIYAQAQQEQLELALQSFSVIKDLQLNKLNTSIELDSEYNDRWRQIESQINTENALAEEIRQYNASLAEQKRQANMDNAYKQSQLALAQKELAQQQAQWQAEFNAQYGSSGSKLTSGSSSSSKKSSSSSSSKKSSSSKTSSTKLKEGSTNNYRDKISKNSSSSSKSSGSVKLSNGKTGYSSPITAWSKSGKGTPYSEATLLKKGYVKQVAYNGKVYYYVP